ncbi:hypothetical protein AB0K00_34045 [Dactylosporangium sp. NPDC049525]|uniref:hypothetical protein n=1 Tax=Dactylosporangium sp. NPDC049525 TaxID=3154730 RepID=UPI003448FDD5
MTADPVVTALLRRIVELRPASDPLHDFARTVLSGEATLRAAAEHPAFEETFAEALRNFDPPGDGLSRLIQRGRI